LPKCLSAPIAWSQSPSELSLKYLNRRTPFKSKASRHTPARRRGLRFPGHPTCPQHRRCRWVAFRCVTDGEIPDEILGGRPPGVLLETPGCVWIAPDGLPGSQFWPPCPSLLVVFPQRGKPKLIALPIDTVAITSAVYHVIRFTRETLTLGGAFASYSRCHDLLFRDIPFPSLARHIGQGCLCLFTYSSMTNSLMQPEQKILHAL